MKNQNQSTLQLFGHFPLFLISSYFPLASHTEENVSKYGVFSVPYLDTFRVVSMSVNVMLVADIFTKYRKIRYFV